MKSKLEINTNETFNDCHGNVKWQLHCGMDYIDRQGFRYTCMQLVNIRTGYAVWCVDLESGEIIREYKSHSEGFHGVMLYDHWFYDIATEYIETNKPKVDYSHSDWAEVRDYDKMSYDQDR